LDPIHQVWKQGEPNAPVNTVGYVCQREDGVHSRTDRLRQNAEGFVVNDDGQKSTAIHQWMKCFKQLYSPVDFIGGPKVVAPQFG
jgi:hypothetical protein